MAVERGVRSVILKFGCSLESPGKFLKLPDAQKQAQTTKELQRWLSTGIFEKFPE